MSQFVVGTQRKNQGLQLEVEYLGESDVVVDSNDDDEDTKTTNRPSVIKKHSVHSVGVHVYPPDEDRYKTIEPKQSMSIHTSAIIRPPEGYFCRIFPMNKMMAEYSVYVMPAIIDR